MSSFLGSVTPCYSLPNLYTRTKPNEESSACRAGLYVNYCVMPGGYFIAYRKPQAGTVIFSCEKRYAHFIQMLRWDTTAAVTYCQDYFFFLCKCFLW